MEHLKYERDDNLLKIALLGKIDSSNATDIDAEIMDILAQGLPDSIIVDLADLEYISSAGLRIILKLKRRVSDIRLINASSEVYAIFEMTGFNEMMNIEKAYRVISTAGCEMIGTGANGDVYRIDRDTIVKVYRDPEALPDIHRERELARTAFIKGVPTAIPYDVVKIEGGRYGSVFELLNASSFIDLLSKLNKPLDEVVRMSVDLLKIIHSTTVDPDSIPSMKEVALTWVDSIKGHLPDEIWDKLYRMMDAVPEDNHLMHGDFHLKNIMLQKGESLLIDMETLCHGNPIFEFGGMFYTYIAFDELNPANTLVFLGISSETAAELWKRTFRLYLGDVDEDTLQAAMTKAKIIGYTHLMSRQFTKGDPESEKGKKVIENCRRHLIELVPQTDTLIF